MKYRRLGDTDIEVSVVALGCWAIVGDWAWGDQEENDTVATVEAALDAGVTFFDTAEAYGNGYSEEILGKTLGSRRRDVVIATKLSPVHLSADEVPKACERSLRRLGTDYIDLYQAHWANPSIPYEETMPALEKLREQGKVRAIGVCNFGVESLSGLLAVGRCVTNQLPYNLLWRAIEYEIVPECLDHGIGLLPYSPIAQGLLTGKFSSAAEVPDGRARTRHFSKDRALTRHGETGCEAETFAAIDRIRVIGDALGRPMGQVALGWLLHQPGVVSVLAGARNAHQMLENARAAELSLSRGVLDELAEATDALKRTLGPNPDMWQSDSRFF